MDEQKWAEGDGSSENTFYLVAFFLLGFFSLAKSVFDTGGVKYNLGDATGQGKRSKKLTYSLGFF